MKHSGHNRESILEAIRQSTRRLGRVPTNRELKAGTGVSKHFVLRHFGSLAAAIRKAGFEPVRRTARLPDRAILEDWAGVVRDLGRLPSTIEYIRRGKYSSTVFFTRYGEWAAIPEVFIDRFADRREWAKVCEIIRKSLSSQKPQTRAGAQASGLSKRPGQSARAERTAKKLPGRPTCGDPLNFRGLRNEPTNELGVVLLFGAVARDLGFQVDTVQPGFPDCEALRRIAPGKWQRRRIEFELDSRNFRDSGHPVEGCDLIVCWLDNWPECPIEVLELSSAIKSLPLWR